MQSLLSYYAHLRELQGAKLSDSLTFEADAYTHVFVQMNELVDQNAMTPFVNILTPSV